MLQRLLVLALFICNSPFAAEPVHLDVGLSLQRQKVEWRYANQVRRTTLDSIEIHVIEKFWPNLYGILRLGQIDVSQASNPITQGQTTNGEYITVGVGGTIYNGNWLALSSQLELEYHQSENNDQNQDVELRWVEAHYDLSTKFRVSDNLHLTTSLIFNYTDGEERSRGAIDQILNFEEENPVGGRLRVDLGLDRRGHIGVEIQAGYAEGGRVYFRRWF